jgi:hypothetical protein
MHGLNLMVEMMQRLAMLIQSLDLEVLAVIGVLVEQNPQESVKKGCFPGSVITEYVDVAALRIQGEIFDALEIMKR